MGFRTLTASSLLAIVAIASAGAAQADIPAPAAPSDFYVGPSADRQGITARVTSGTFAVNPDQHAITLTDPAGDLIAAVPLTLRAKDGRQYRLQPTIRPDGRELVIRSIDFPHMNATAVSSLDRWNAEVQRGTFGALLGGGIGLAVGFVAGSGVGALVTTPLFALIGFFAAGGQPLIDAGIAYFSGRP